MSERMIVQHCSPTLAGMKTGNLFLCPFESNEDMLGFVRRLNKTLSEKGLRVLPLRNENCRTLIYVYRMSHLSRDLQHDKARQMLLERGYTCETAERCLAQLIRRLCENGEFPHEIGLFLGYPPEDVSGFIENKACGCKYVGEWKVYGDAEAARIKFDRFRKCTQAYRRQFEKGKTIECLAVAG